MSRLITLVFFLTFLSWTVSFAASGTIENGFHTTKVCHDAACISPTPGELNFRPTGATTVIIDDALGLSGDVWGTELGWITLNPTGEGVVFADPGTGLLSGKAWSQVSGWINFSATGQSVTIDPSTGEFDGWAWTGGPYGGWIKFDCSSGDTCIKTSWRGDAGGGDSGGSSGGSSGSRADICPNISGSQSSLPQGHSVDGNGNCFLINDKCQNIEGVQSEIPIGFFESSSGMCTFSVDYCPNIAGTQTSIPSGYIVTSTGSCIKNIQDSCPDRPGIQATIEDCVGKDMCSNIFGAQQTLPQGYIQNGGECLPQQYDLCPNIYGGQYELPEGYTVTSDGTCVEMLPDACSNLAGTQEQVPTGFYAEFGICFFGTKSDVPVIQDPALKEVVSLPFIPKSIQVPTNVAFVDSVVRLFGLNESDTFSVDAISTVVVSAFGLFLLYLLIRVLRFV